MKATGSMGALGINGVIYGVLLWPHGLLNSQTQCIIFLNRQMVSPNCVHFFMIACCNMNYSRFFSWPNYACYNIVQKLKLLDMDHLFIEAG